MASNDCTVLIVDDDRDIRDTVSDVLSMADYEVVQAVNGQDALDQLARGRRIDLILLDLMMPVMNGFELLQALRGHEEWRNIPVVMASSNRGFNADDIGVAAVLRKPYTVEALISIVRRALSKGDLAPGSPA
jgi:CheY-like chemotaxis protein